MGLDQPEPAEAAGDRRCYPGAHRRKALLSSAPSASALTPAARRKTLAIAPEVRFDPRLMIGASSTGCRAPSSCCPIRRRRWAFTTSEEYERLLAVAQKRSPDAYLMVLLGGEAGLRLGEIVALEWGDIDLQARRLTSSDPIGAVT